MDNQSSTLTNERCESTSSSSFWRWPSGFAWRSSLVRKSRSRSTSVVRAAQAGLAALSRTVNVNHRLVVAVVFMLMLAPAASICYLPFDRSVKSDWYYVNNFYLLLTLAPFITQACISIGIFFLFPAGSKRSYFLSIPLALAIAKILWLLTVNSNEDYYSIVPTFFLVVAGLIALLTLFTFDWLTARKYHGFDAICHRIEHIINARKRKLISEEQADELLAQENHRLKTFHQQY